MPDTQPCSRSVPLWLVLLDNVPTLLMYALGVRILYALSLPAAVLYGAYCLSIFLWFWARICPSCHQYGLSSCPCGYGIVSSRLFARAPARDFRRVFSRNLPYVYAAWFIPPVAAAFQLWRHYSPTTLLILIAFSLVGFVGIPLISKLVGCRNCPTRAQCPWVTCKNDPNRK